MIELQGLSQRFPGGSGEVHALRDVSLSIASGEIFGIIGRSGAGKSTLVRAINLLNRPTSGRVIVAGQDLTALDKGALREARREIGMIFQHFNLLSSRTVYDNVALPLELAGKSKQEIASTVEPLLELVGLSKLRDRYPAQISGGQKQRVGIARALASKPKVLLSDEATSALDPETTRAILDLLKQINRELGLTIVMITHQMEVIKQVCDRVAVLEAGQVVESGRVIDVFLRPQHEVTRAMIGDVIAQELPVSVLKRVESRLGNGRDHVYRLAFTGENVDQPVLAQAIRQHGLDFNILHGHIDEIQGQAFGSLAIMATGELADVRAAMDYLQSQGVVVEEIEHVV
ncbi:MULTISPECIES: methionine ABC transporter ATP-binding protein [Cupriavidus]|jgi:D-methionine transport system ATP-binding protein|uniref:Methionine import ATP-binding protein MetN n=2 Tax=Cupriavidus metallidurans TaxID=119219 RepID=METN_CUPMC|nr:MULTISPECIES: methionine ABC transporter ATP-binding protein [Cupriavidus]Q1LQF6.1 RecName: Full=Methionine import ATP-binding protein MetN [Cupriavidus metallidurans CH34]PCH57949.1 MAG: methionine import ATP-binding protein MetN [Burkholderiaceae bacterium]HBO80785.1 methionine ABC transporter ATP-binding protein [Cupriavidus sp.]ABF07620.1 DL-methionine transporter subunit; ATP-binding component of ABC superfamily [Cupriavidus metallidurans CH34]EKZ99991.1 DL-methionine transporter ATP-b